MITLSELQLKEIVMLQTGKRIGFITDFEIDEATGSITSFVVATRQLRGNLFNRKGETIILWKNIVTIGDDIILINDENIVQHHVENNKNSGN